MDVLVNEVGFDECPSRCHLKMNVKEIYSTL